MRPDEHKQKRSAQYKKKHGLKTQETDDKSQKGGKGKGKHNQHDSKTKSQAKNSVASSATNSTVSASNVKNKSSDLATVVDKVDDDPLYQKRAVENNWARYEGLPSDPEDEEELVTLRGADFKQMLDAAGETLSQFRFQDEKDWNVDEESQLPSCLSIESTDLSMALSCIPLHLRLSIDESKFQETEIEFFKKDADISKQSYISRTNPDIIADDARFDQIADVHKPISSTEDDKILDNILGDDTFRDISEISTNKPSQPNTESNDILDSILGDENPVHKVNTANNTVTNKRHNSENEDDILDSLLLGEPAKCDTNKSSADLYGKSTEPDGLVNESNQVSNSSAGSDKVPDSKTQVTTNTNSVNIAPAVGKQNTPVVNLEDELDSLLSLDETPKTAVTKPNVKSQETNQNQDGDDLEDWLDSMLE